MISDNLMQVKTILTVPELMARQSSWFLLIEYVSTEIVMLSRRTYTTAFEM